MPLSDLLHRLTPCQWITVSESPFYCEICYHETVPPKFSDDLGTKSVELLAQPCTLKEPIEIYGPQGLRSLIRTTFKLTSSTILREERYRVHEILARDEEHTPCGPEELHHNEIAAEDIRPDSEGLWRDFCVTPTLRVSAAPIVHRVPCIGYVFQETPTANSSPRKVVMLGDTSDPSLIRPLAQNADILLHEATLASVAPDGKVDNPRYAKEAVTERAISRGHSTAEMAGQFAQSIGARILALNHFSARYPGGLDDPVMKEIESQASVAGVSHVKATHDLLSLQLDKAGEPQWTEL